MKKVSRQEFEMAVRKARQYTTNYGKVRFIIAQLALEVCDYSHGGRKGESVFSLKKFAEEIGLDRKTLYQWVRVKVLVIDKLPKGIQKKPETYAYQDYDDVSDQVTDETPPAEVRRVLTEVLAQPLESKKFSKYIKHLNAIFYNVSRPMIMKDVERKHIDTMLEKTNIIHNLLKAELTLREKYPDSKRRDTKRLNVGDELAKRIKDAG